MATQGILSIMVDDKVILKLVTGSDGYNIPKIAKDVKKEKVTSLERLKELCIKHGLSLESPSLIIQTSLNTWWSYNCNSLS